jgi:hypothetical protein
MWEVVMQFHLATAVAVMGLITVVAVYFLLVRKLDKKEGQPVNSAGSGDHRPALPSQT